MNAEWYHYVLVYSWPVLMFLGVCGLLANPFRKKRGRR